MEFDAIGAIYVAADAFVNIGFEVNAA